MSVRRHLPYKGDRYERGFRGRRLLIVGESHYCETNESAAQVSVPNLTSDVISRFASPGEEYQFFRSLREISSGMASTISPEEFWSSVAFCNFVQRVMVGVADRPTHSDYVTGWSALNETIEELKPDMMFVFSRYAWTNVMDYELHGRPKGDSGRLAAGSNMLWQYSTSYGVRLYAASFNHPSRLNVPIDVWRAWADYVWRSAPKP